MKDNNTAIRVSAGHLDDMGVESLLSMHLSTIKLTGTKGLIIWAENELRDKYIFDSKHVGRLRGSLDKLI